MTANTIDTMIYAGSSIISTSISVPVTLGSGGYADSLTITSSGVIDNASLSTGNGETGDDGIYAGSSSIGTVLNNGTIIGGTGYRAGIGIDLQGADTLINQGLVLGTYSNSLFGGGDGAYLAGQPGASLNNSGTLLGGAGKYGGGAGFYFGSPHGQFDVNAYAVNSGTIAGGNGLTGGTSFAPFGAGGSGLIFEGGTFLNTGLIIGGTDTFVGGPGPVTGGDGVDNPGLNGGVLINAGTISGGVGPGGTLGAAILFSNFFSVPNTIITDPGAVFIGSVTADPSVADVLMLAGTSAGSLDMGSTFTGFSTIDFASGSSWTLEGASIALAAGQTISGFAQGDTIVLDNFAATSQTLGPDGLTLSNATTTETLDITGISQFTITDNADGGTDITTYVACFLRGTRIATPRGQIPVEKLTIGDLVKTMHGPQPIRWIGTRAYAARFIANNPNALPIRIRRHAIAPNIPSRDLYVSPDHAIAEGGVLIHAHLLQNGVSITQPETTADIEYFHLEFDTHTILFAENLPTESFIDEHARHRFQNAHTAPATAPQKPCLPRMAEGFHLQNIKSRIAARAGIRPPTTLGALRGALDECTPTLIRGWAQNTAAPETPVTLEITSGAYTRTIPANTYRPDLRLAGLGSGCHGFALTLPNLTTPITLRRIPDGAQLPNLIRRMGRSG